MSSATFRTTRGGDPQDLIVNLEDALKPEEADLLYAGEYLRTAILERTERGVDYLGRPFAPYNSTRPVYYYPGGKATPGPEGAKRNPASRVRSRNQVFKKLFGPGRNVATVNAAKFRAYDQYASKTPGGGIRFSSYAAMKAAFGRTVVDLFGLSAPHMLQAIAIRVRGALLSLGFYGDEVKRAEAINFGLGTQPRREFFNASPGDKEELGVRIAQRSTARARKVLE